MRISLLGNCQVCGIAGALRSLVPTAQVHAFWYGSASDEDIERVKQTLVQSDYVFTHGLPSISGPLSAASLRKTVQNVVTIPVIYFTGFHPDVIFIPYKGISVMSPVGMPHSALIAAAYCLDLQVDRVRELFNAFVFRRLGYFDEFTKAREFVRKTFNDGGIELAQIWQSWMSTGVFMHTPAHPRMNVLASIAKLLADRVGIMSEDSAIPVISFDYLAHGPIWPVYPELAAALQIPGSYLFKRTGNQSQMSGDCLLLDLEEMIAKSYESYKNCPAEVFRIPSLQRVVKVLSEIVR